MTDIKEKRLTLRIYYCLIALICIDPIFREFVPSTILRSVELLFFVLMSIYFLQFDIFAQLRKLRIPFLLLALFIISVGIVFRDDWNVGMKEFAFKILRRDCVLLYISPFVILTLPNRKYFNEIITVFFRASLLVLPIWLMKADHLVIRDSYLGESIGAFLPFFSAVLLGFSSNFTKTENLFIRFIWFFYFILMLLNARRNVSFTLALYGCIAYAFYLYQKSQFSPMSTVRVVFLGFLAIFFIAVNFTDLTSSTFKSITERANEDTRSGVHELFFADFLGSPSTDWIFGRGMGGGYEQTVINEETGDIKYERDLIETGYLNYLLKGGISYLFVLEMILIISIFRSFKAKSLQMKYIGVILITYLVDQYTTTPIMPYQVRSIIFWFLISLSCSVGTCNVSYKRR